MKVVASCLSSEASNISGARRFPQYYPLWNDISNLPINNFWPLRNICADYTSVYGRTSQNQDDQGLAADSSSSTARTDQWENN